MRALYCYSQTLIGCQGPDILTSKPETVKFFTHIECLFRFTDSPQRLQNSNPETQPFEVTVTRRENEGFGFVIISSVTRVGSMIGTCHIIVICVGG